jgi:hypothetical protein
MAQVLLLIYLLFSYTFVLDLPVRDVRLIWMLNYVIMRYTLIFDFILIIIDNITPCMYCGVHVGAPGLLLKPGVTEVVSEPYRP